MGNESNSNSKESNSNSSWKDAMTSAMIYDRGGLTMTQTGNNYLNGVGGYIMKNSSKESNENWEKARQMAEKENAIEEFEKKKRNGMIICLMKCLV